MAIFTISYDLIKFKDYPELWKEFDRLGGQKILESVYLVNLNNTTEQVRDHFKEYIDEDDMLIVSKTTEFKYIKALKGTGDWIAKNL